MCSDIFALCLSSRRNLCIHKEVATEDDRERVDSLCRAKTAFAQNIEGSDKCDYYFNYMDKADQIPKPTGIYTLDDLKDLGRREDM